MDSELLLEVLRKQTELHDDWLREHHRRLDKLENSEIEFRSEIRNLCNQITTLTYILKWFIGLMIGGIVGFFFYAIQTNIF